MADGEVRPVADSAELPSCLMSFADFSRTQERETGRTCFPVLEVLSVRSLLERCFLGGPRMIRSYRR